MPWPGDNAALSDSTSTCMPHRCPYRRESCSCTMDVAAGSRALRKSARCSGCKPRRRPAARRFTRGGCACSEKNPSPCSIFLGTSHHFLARHCDRAHSNFLCSECKQVLPRPTPLHARLWVWTVGHRYFRNQRHSARLHQRDTPAPNHFRGHIPLCRYTLTHRGCRAGIPHRRCSASGPLAPLGSSCRRKIS